MHLPDPPFGAGQMHFNFDPSPHLVLAALSTTVRCSGLKVRMVEGDQHLRLECKLEALANRKCFRDRDVVKNEAVLPSVRVSCWPRTSRIQKVFARMARCWQQTFTAGWTLYTLFYISVNLILWIPSIHDPAPLDCIHPGLKVDCSRNPDPPRPGTIYCGTAVSLR